LKRIQLGKIYLEICLIDKGIPASAGMTETGIHKEE
jgi:hypothetical protein